MKKKTIILTLTENCNLNCVYCYETNKSDKRISLDLAKDKVIEHMKNASGVDEIEIDLFGG